jgi:hypothetical protein
MKAGAMKAVTLTPRVARGRGPEPRLSRICTTETMLFDGPHLFRLYPR